MLSYLEALDILRGAANPPRSHRIATQDARGHVLAEDFIAPISLPRFDNSSMDGFALCTTDTQGASEANPVILPVRRAIAAGDAAGIHLAGQAVEIMTGAAIPDEADGVIPIEDISPVKNDQDELTHIRISRPVPLHDNIRFTGEDVQAGQLLIKKGTLLTPSHIAILFATGTTTITVSEMPTVRIFTTGKEVSDDYTQPLGPSQIYNSNTPYLIAELQGIGIPATCAGHIGDEEERFRALLQETTDARILVSSGAVSKGKWDFIPSILKEFGAEILFHRVAIKPGKPVLFARLSDGRYFFGLPGNPISAAIGLRFFLMPLLRRLLGLADEQPRSAELSADFNKKGPLRLFLKARTQINTQGINQVDILPGQESFKIAPLLQTNAWAVFTEPAAAFSAGQAVQYYPRRLLG